MISCSRAALASSWLWSGVCCSSIDRICPSCGSSSSARSPTRNNCRTIRSRRGTVLSADTQAPHIASLHKKGVLNPTVVNLHHLIMANCYYWGKDFISTGDHFQTQINKRLFDTHLLWLVSAGNSCCRVMSRASRLRQHWDKKRSTGSMGRTDRSSNLDTALSSPAAKLSGTTPNLV